MPEDVTATAIAARDVVADVVIVQDVTVSFIEELPDAIDADKALVDAFAAHHPEGVRVGVVNYARGTGQPAGLTELTFGGPTSLHTTLDTLARCTSIGSSGGPCYGTDTGAGIDRALQLLAADGREDVPHVIVLVSDGVPCFLENGDPVGTGQAAATAAANAAGAADVDLFAVTLYTPSGSSHPCLSSDITFNESLARGIGWGTTTTNEEQLEAILTSIVNELPIQLVK